MKNVNERIEKIFETMLKIYVSLLVGNYDPGVDTSSMIVWDKV